MDARLGEYVVRVEAKPPRLTVKDDAGTLLFDGVPGGFGVGRAEATIEHQFGSFKFDETTRDVRAAARLAELRFVPGGGEGGGDAIVFSMRDAGGRTLGTGSVSAPPEAPGKPLVIELLAAAPSTPAAPAGQPGVDRVELAFACDDGEHFLGLGGQSFDVDHRGQRVPIWVQEDGIGKSPDADDEYLGAWFLTGRRHSTHTPMPVFLSSRGVVFALDTPFRSVFDLCGADPAAATIETWEPRLRALLFAAPSPAAGVERLTAHVGRPALPPPFAFAPWLDALYGSENVRRVAAKLRAEGVASSVIWTEDFRGGAFSGEQYVLDEDWEIDAELYPDFAALADDLHALGFKFLVYQNSFLTSSVPTFAEAVAGGHTIRDAAGDPYLFTGVKFEDSSLLDLSSPAAVAWAKGKYRVPLEAGADGYMADFAEWLPTDAVLASGSAWEQHNLYPVQWARLHHELFAELHAADGVDRLFFVRAAYMGSQPLVSVVWAGDQQTDFSEGDGYPSVIPMGIGLGLTGFPYYGHDVGGYMSQATTPTSEELWYRWVTLGALSPVMRTHHGRAVNDNWHWEKDAAATAHFARWAQLHLRLFPYLYGMAKLAADTGAPMFRPLAFDYPGFAPGWTRVDQFMLGDRIIVAPVISMGATTRGVALPAGRFYPLLGGPVVVSAGDGSELTVSAPPTEIPAFVPEGALLVLLPEGVDTLAPASDAAVTTLEDAGSARELWVWPGGASSFTEAGGLAYEWDGAGLTGPLESAVWNGGPLVINEGTVTVTGPGTLVFNGGEATLEILGGDAARETVVRPQGL